MSKKSKGDWRWLREEFNTTQLADLLGVKRQLIDNWVRGRNDPDFISTLALATLVGSVEELERRVKVKVPLNIPADPKSTESLGFLTDRNYDYLISVAEYLKYISRFQELHAHAHAALKHTAGKDKFLTAKLWFDIGYAQLMLGNPLEGVESASKARKLLAPKEDSILRADTHWFTGECLRVVGKLSEAYPYLDEARKIYKRLRVKPSFHESGPIWLEWDLGRYFATYGRYDTALRHFERMEKMARDTWLAEAQVIAAWSRGDIAEMRSEFDKAIANYLYARGLAEISGDRFWAAAAIWRCAEVYRKLGQFKNAVATAESVRSRFETIGNGRMVAKSNCVLAACYLQTGEFDKAAHLYNNSIDVFTNNEDAQMERNVLLGLGLIDLAFESQKVTPNFRKPLQAFLEMEPGRSSIYDPYLAVYNDLASAEALRLAGLSERALTRFNDAIKTSNTHGFQLEQAHAILGVAATKLMAGEADRQSCIEAAELYQKVGSSWGQVQAVITQALIEQETGNVYSHLLQQAVMLARANSSESQFIKKIANQKSLSKKRHVLLFVQAV